MQKSHTGSRVSDISVFEADSDQKRLAGLVSAGFGLDRFDHVKAFFEQLHQLAVAAAVEHFDH